MKKSAILIISLFVTIAGFAQSMYSTNTNRVIISTIVNSDTVIIENLNNRVRINGDLDLLEVEYDNATARMVTEAKNISEERSDMIIKFHNEYLWLDERLKTDQKVLNFTDEIHVEINDMDQLIPVNFIIQRIRGGQGFNTMVEIRGSFNGEGLEEDFPHLKFESDLQFAIFLTVQAVN